MQDTEVATHSDYTTKSRNYKLGVAQENVQAVVQGNVVFDPSSQLPREVLLETTLKAFGFSMDLWEVCFTAGRNNQGFIAVSNCSFTLTGNTSVLFFLLFALLDFFSQFAPEIKAK